MDKKRAFCSQKILVEVITAIKNGDIRPGDRIVAKEIADRLGTSLIPVREFLFWLTGQDILTERYREGFYLTALNVAMLHSFYREHARVIDASLELWRPGVRATRVPRDLWGQFAMIAEQTRCAGLIGIQRYLAGRLLPARLHEMERPVLRNLSGALARACRAGDIAAMSDECARFHQWCLHETSRIHHKISML